MISAVSTSQTNIWDHARNVRDDFIRHSHFEEVGAPIFDLFGGYSDYSYYYDNENTSYITTETPNDEIDTYGKYHFNSDSYQFIDQENIERNYRNMHRLLKSTYNETNNTKNIDSISENIMINGALLFVFLNSNPDTDRRQYLIGLFDKIIEEESFKSILMTNQVTNISSPIEKEIATNFFSKLASLVGFQFIFPRNYGNPLVTNNFSIEIKNVQGFF